MFLEDTQGKSGKFEQEEKVEFWVCMSRLEKKMRVENEGGGYMKMKGKRREK